MSDREKTKEMEERGNARQVPDAAPSHPPDFLVVAHSKMRRDLCIRPPFSVFPVTVLSILIDLER